MTLKKLRLRQTVKAAKKQPEPLPEGLVRLVAMECWRIRKLVPEFADNRKHLVLRTSVQRMVDALRSSGVEIEDPEGAEFKDDMAMRIAMFDNSDELEAGRRIVTETLSPGIYIHNKLAQSARVVVSIGRKHAELGA